MEDEDFNPWKELADHGITRSDQIEDMKDWLAVRQLHIDQAKKRWEDNFHSHSPKGNLWRLEMLEGGQFRLDIDKWQLEQFISRLDEGPPQTEGE